MPALSPEFKAALETWPWLKAAYYEIGQKEIPGSRNNPRIVEYLKAGGMPHEPDETPWCASFVGWCLASVSLKHTGKPNARSYSDFGLEVPPRWSDPLWVLRQLGAIVVLSRTGDPSFGHVGFLAGVQPTEDDTSWEVILLGGNQHDSVSFAHFPIERVVAVRWPEDFRSAAPGTSAIDKLKVLASAAPLPDPEVVKRETVALDDDQVVTV